MRAFLIFGTVLFFATLAFAQADSCNMSLVDEWTMLSTAEWPVPGSGGLDMYENFIFVAVRNQLITLEIDSTGSLSFVDSLNRDVSRLAVKDSFLFVTQTIRHGSEPDSTILTVYGIDPIGAIDSITSYIYDLVTTLVLFDDTLLFLGKSKSGIILNAVKADSLFQVTEYIFSDIDASISLYPSYPLIFNGGYSTRGEYPWTDYTQGRINVLNASDPDSIYVANQFWTQTGSRGNSTQVTNFAIKDSILYVEGDGLDIEVYSFNSTGSTIDYLYAFTDSLFFYSSACANMFTVDDYLVTSSRYLAVYDISDIEVLEVLGYYKRDPHGIEYDIRYMDSSVKDSFIVSLGVQNGSDSIRISVMKIPNTGSSGNCELFQCPQNLELDIFPNPFNSALRISAPENATVTIHDTEGRMVADLGKSRLWNAGEDVPSGVYIVRAVVGDVVVDGKCVLIR